MDLNEVTAGSAPHGQRINCPFRMCGVETVL